MDRICFADFVTSCEEKKSTKENGSDGEDDNDIVIHHRQKIKIILFRRYKLQQDRYNHFREQVLLFFPWRNEINDVENQE